MHAKNIRAWNPKNSRLLASFGVLGRHNLDKGREVIRRGARADAGVEPSDRGSKQYRTEIVAFSVQFLGARPSDVPQCDVEPPSGTIDEDVPF